jgi:hypothetical protein
LSLIDNWFASLLLAIVDYSFVVGAVYKMNVNDYATLTAYQGPSNFYIQNESGFTGAYIPVSTHTANAVICCIACICKQSNCTMHV